MQMNNQDNSLRNIFIAVLSAAPHYVAEQPLLRWVNLTQIVAAFQRCSAAPGPPYRHSRPAAGNIANQVTQRFNDIQTTMHSRYVSQGEYLS